MENDVREYPDECYFKDVLLPPPPGYRWLKVGEKILDTDEYFSSLEERWVSVLPGNHWISVEPNDDPYRRKLVPTVETQSAAPAIQTSKVEYVIEHNGALVHQSQNEKDIKTALRFLIEHNVYDPKDLDVYKVTTIKGKLDV